MSNKFTEIFEKPRGVINIIEHICGKLRENTGFSKLSPTTQQELPAFAAWIAEEMKVITPTQLRRFYTYVKGIERKASQKEETGKLDERTRAKLKFLLPKLAGSANVKKTEEKESMGKLYKVFSVCIYENDKIQNKEDLERFVEFFEAILDYHSTFKKEN